MDSDNVAQSPGLVSQGRRKLTRLFRNDQKWDALKEAIHRIYVVENNSLPSTMQQIKQKYGFKASPRKWKSKLKEWKFDKYLSDADKRVIVAKTEKRAREGKDTIFFHGESEITAERIQNFKRRNGAREVEAISPSAETPGHINYHTPKPEDPDVAPVAEKTRETVDEDLDINLVAEMTLESNDDVDVDPLTQPVIRGHSSRPEEVDLLVTDQCPYYRLPPFTITKKHPSEVTSDTAAKAEAQAVEYDVIDDVTNAVPAYLDAIEQRAQVSGGDSASVCSLLSRLASIYNATGRLEESISTYRRAIAPYREGLLESVLRCVPDMCQLAEALISQGEYVEAEDIFRRAIQILAKEGDQIGTASYNLKLVELLQKQDRHEDAIGILHPLLNTQMQISGDDFASILCTLRHMKSSYEKLYSGGQCSGVITRMSSVVADLIGSNRLDSPRFFQGFLSIADSFSSKGEFGIATSMYKAAMSTASENPRPNCRYRKAQYLYYYAKHLCRIPDYATVLSHLQGSVAILVELGRREGKLAHRVRSFFNWILGDLERVEKNQDMLDNILKIQALLSGSRSTITSSNSQNVIRPADELESEGKSEMRTTTTSNKYGVTFSVSDITGISLSEFFVP